MTNPNAIIDGIRSISPKREIWAGKPAEELPENVTVNFERSSIFISAT